MSLSVIPKIETLGPGEIVKYQETRLQEALQYLQINSPFYSKLFAEHKIDVTKIRTLTDLRNIPTTDKENLQASNMDFLCVEPGKIIDYITTSGTLGTPITFRRYR